VGSFGGDVYSFDRQNPPLLLRESGNILRSFAPPPEALIQVTSTGGDDEQIEVDGMDDELRVLFPATVTYMDLSSLKLKKPLPRIPLPLLIRKEYGIITNMLNKLPEGNAGSVIISGQPGTGETFLLFSP
jgi:hypothetical protein